MRKQAGITLKERGGRRKKLLLLVLRAAQSQRHNLFNAALYCV